MIFRIYAWLTALLMKDRSHWKTLPRSEKPRAIWFHAASAGELEILVPLIEASVQAGRPTCVSIFSPSAESSLKKLPPELLYRGFSPSERDWLDAIRHFNVDEMVTSKYEAWPGMWRAGSIAGIKVTVVCAQPRSSLIWAKRILRWMGIPLPALRFYALEQDAVYGLKVIFPKADVVLSADPRWFRVLKRAEHAHAHPGLQKWRERFSGAPKPYWVIGSAWPEDMEFLSPQIRNYPGTVWVAPHSFNPPPSPEVFVPYPNCVLVDEMGLLVELYSIADRAWVGGGFGKGIHSTLEPSVYSIPVACGPHEVEKFYEARELMQAGVLKVCQSEKDVEQWLNSPSQKTNFSLKLKMEMIQQLIQQIAGADQ